MDEPQSLQYELVKERILSMSEDELERLFQSIAQGKSVFPLISQFEEKEADVVEALGFSLYRNKQYQQALTCMVLLMLLTPSRISVWRCAGASLYMMRRYQDAAYSLEMAHSMDASDLSVKVLLAECWCMLGRAEEGMKYLEESAQAASDGVAERDYYIARAQKVLSARQHSAKVLSGEAVEAVSSVVVPQASEGASLDASRPITVDDMLANPFLAQAMDVVKTLVLKGKVSLGDVGGMTQQEYDGAYACACQFAHAGRFLEAVKLACLLMVVDGRDGRYAQLAGICMHRMKHYAVADQLYAVAMQLSPKDPTVWVYRGELLWAMGDQEKAKEWIARGLKEAEKHPEKHAELISRAQRLQQYFRA
jgi:predicted Zn-dependent protease